MLEKQKKSKIKENNVFEKWKYKKESETFKEFFNETKTRFFWKNQFDLKFQLILELGVGLVSILFFNDRIRGQFPLPNLIHPTPNI
jgi:hypothetical protein